MTQSYVIEIGDEPVGLVVADGAGRFVFHAASSRFGALDGRAFASVRAAEKAASELRRRPSLRPALPFEQPRPAAGGR